MPTFDLPTGLGCLISKESEKFPCERAIRLLQFQTWIYFPDEYQMVDGAGRLAAAAILRRMGQKTILNSKTLVGLLKDKSYGSLYDAFFGGENGWTELLTTVTAETFNQLVLSRRNIVETTCEMVDFRFRGIDHETLDPKEANIAHAVFFRGYNHPRGYLSSKTIRQRWKINRASAPFLYVSEQFGFHFFPPPLDLRYPRTMLIRRAPDQNKITEFIATSLYVAEKLDAHVLKDYAGLWTLKISRRRPTTTALSEPELVRMKQYKEKREDMRDDLRQEAEPFQ